jgi:4'-phosphopantetheinyl transferase
MTAHAVLLAIPCDPAAPPPQRVQVQRAHARRALRRCAELCAAPLDGWRQDERGAPLAQEGFFWSISHKRRMAAAVIAREPVGIDVELIAPRRDDLFDAVATEAEWSLFPDRSWLSFFRVFTAKEATLKANGLGIGYLAACKVVEAGEARMILELEQRRFSACHAKHDDHLASVSSPDPHNVVWRLVTNEDVVFHQTL